MERRVRGNLHARCEAGENSEITSKNYLSLSSYCTDLSIRRCGCCSLFLSTKMQNVSGISTSSDVQKTADLFMKTKYMDEITGGKGIVFATGTPNASPYQH